MTTSSLDRRSVRRRTASIAAGQSMVKGGQLVIALLLVHLLSSEDWNQIAFLLSIHLAGVTLGTLNLQHGLLFFLRSIERPRALIVRTIAVMVSIGALLAVALAFAADTVGATTNSQHWVPWIGLAILLELPAACLPTTLIALDRTGTSAIWDITTASCQLCCVVVPAAAGLGTRGVVYGLVISASCKLLAFAVTMARVTSGPWRGLAPGSTRTLARYGLPLAGALAVGVLNRSVDKWFIAAFRPNDVGLYSIAAQEIPLLAVLPYAGGAAVATQLVDAFREGRPHDARHWWHQQTAAMARLVVPMSVALIMIAPELFTLLLGARGTAGVLSFQLFTAITMHRVAEYGLVLRAADRTRQLVSSAVLLLVANAVMAGIGAAAFGMAGAAAGTLLANIVAWLAVLLQIGRALGTNLSGAFPWQEWATAVVASIGAAVVATLAVELLRHAGLLMAGSAASWGVLVAKLLVFGLVGFTSRRRWVGAVGDGPVLAVTTPPRSTT